MRFIRPVETENLVQLSPVVWRGSGGEGAFIFEPGTAFRFVCFLLQAQTGHAAPKISLDYGGGFDEASALSLRAFPFGFYHISLAGKTEVRRLRFRACEGGGTFRCVIFQTAAPIPVAVLHYLFNLRYRDIGVFAPSPNGASRRASLAINVARIHKFVSDVSAGRGVRVQQDDGDILTQVVLAQSQLARPVADDMRARLAPRSDTPLISFVAPVYDTPPRYLRDLLASFAGQAAPYAELILANDGSSDAATLDALDGAEAVSGVKVRTLAHNQGIAAATNAGIDAAKGDWISFIDHDDAFAAGAIAVIAKAILDHPDADFFYTDEIVTDAGLQPTGSFCKPAYDSVLMSGMNYINHFSIFRRARLEELGGLRVDLDGSQDYDLLLRYLDGLRPGCVVHIPFLGYLWRRAEASYSARYRERSVGNARKALRQAFARSHARIGVEAAIDPDLHRIRFIGDARPPVSVVIPNRDSFALISRLVDDLQRRTTYPAFDIVVVDNGTTDPAVLGFYEMQRSERFQVELIVEPFNFAAMCNRGARLAGGRHLLFLNNDIEVIEPDWLAEMVECLSFEGTGIVGAKLLYPGGKIQHAGVIVGLGDAAGHWYVDEDADALGPMGRLAVRQTIGAVTGACMLVTRPCFDAVGGFDETAFPIAYNDVDFCIRARHVGFRTIWTPFATLVHHESASRGSDEVGDNNIRFKAEQERLRERHGATTLIDDAYSPFYDRRYHTPHLIAPQGLPTPRRSAFA